MNKKNPLDVRTLYCERCKKWTNFTELKKINLNQYEKIVIVKCIKCDWIFWAEKMRKIKRSDKE